MDPILSIYRNCLDAALQGGIGPVWSEYSDQGWHGTGHKQALEIVQGQQWLFPPESMDHWFGSAAYFFENSEPFPGVAFDGHPGKWGLWAAQKHALKRVDDGAVDPPSAVVVADIQLKRLFDLTSSANDEFVTEVRQRLNGAAHPSGPWRLKAQKDCFVGWLVSKCRDLWEKDEPQGFRIEFPVLGTGEIQAGVAIADVSAIAGMKFG